MRFVSSLAGALLLAVASASPTSGAVSVCQQLSARLPSKLAKSYSSLNTSLIADYNEAKNRYFDIANADDEPACVFFPSCAEDVAVAMKLLSAAPTVPFALKSGGHNWNRGFSSVNGGVLISFRPNMNYTKPSADRMSAEVGPGARWTEVMEKLDTIDRCAVGGRSGDVGVGGYVILGGISYLTSQYGFASDNVLEFEVVLANGTIVTASKTSHQDLFWALRGGGNLFGVVTKFTLQIHPIGNVWGGSRTYTEDKAPQLISAVTNYIANFNEIKSALIPTIAWVGALNGTSIWTIFYFWDGDMPPAHVFAEFDKISSIADLTKTQRYPEILDMSAVTGFTIRSSDAISSLPNMPHKEMTEFLQWHYAEANRSTYLHTAADSWSLFSMALQPIPVALQRQNFQRGPSALQTDPRHGDKLWIEYSLGWTNATCDQTCPQTLLNMVNAGKLHQQQKYAGVKPTNYEAGDLSHVPYNPLFANDAQVGQPVLQSYGEATYKRLKNLHAAYDPLNVFLLQTKGFQF